MAKNTEKPTIVGEALKAFKNGYQPIPIRESSKRPYGGAWTDIRHKSAEEVKTDFEKWVGEGATNLGVLLGEPSGGLIDIDLDHALASRLKDYLLPDTPAKTGRSSRPSSHYWYKVTEGTEFTPGTRRYKLPDGSVTVELRSTGSQTVIPPSMHPDNEPYLWEGTPWANPKEINGQHLAAKVAVLGMMCVILENWPHKGSRHDAYLSLAGGLLRYRDTELNPVWEHYLYDVIQILAEVTHDEDGPEARIAEAVETTIEKLRKGDRVSGFPTLGRIIGDEHAQQIKRMSREVESLFNFDREIEYDQAEADDGPTVDLDIEDDEAETISSWTPRDLGPYLSGELSGPKPSILQRDDGKYLMYAGRVNLLYGSSESAKSWVAMIACLQEIAHGERVMYLDYEDEPSGAALRMRQLQANYDDVQHQFIYASPTEPHAKMQWNSFGEEKPTGIGRRSETVLRDTLKSMDPRLVVVDGMTTLYSLHGLNPDKASDTDIISRWLKSMTRDGLSTVIVIDHTKKNALKGSTPMGSQHKVSMVQGSALQVVPIVQPKPGARGHVELVVGKDRVGEVRAVSTDEEDPVAADVILDSSPEGIIDWEVLKPSGSSLIIDVTGRSDLLPSSTDEISRRETEVIDAFGGDLDLKLSRSEIEHTVASSKSPKTLSRTLIALVNQNVLTSEGTNKGRLYRLYDETENTGKVSLT